jgi:hypothetical protein
VELCDQRALTALRWHWGSAYSVQHPEPGVWLAWRRDTREMLRADSAEALRESIITDYFACPVPRGQPPDSPAMATRPARRLPHATCSP